SKGMLAKTPWNKGKSSKRDPRILSGRKHPQYGKPSRISELNKKPEFIKKRLKGLIKKPNKPEKIMINLIKKNNLPFNYVGNGQIIIEGFCPDFLSKNPKQIIEVFGDYWHLLLTLFMILPQSQHSFKFKCFDIFSPKI
ncbi:unnamed protein product, partial [marine sediment metagenome]